MPFRHRVFRGSTLLAAAAAFLGCAPEITFTPPEVAGVIVAGAPVQLLVGDTASLTATAADPRGRPLSGMPAQWTSSNTSVATVSASGLVTALGVGSAQIRATMNGVVGTATVTVAVPSAAIFTDGTPNSHTSGIPSGILSLGNFGKPQVFSVSFWFRPVITSERIFVLLDAQHWESTNWVYQYLDAANGWCFSNACVQLASNTWHHILLTYNNGTLRYFVNGALRVTQGYTINYTATAPTLYLGNWFYGGRQFSGSIDDLYITTDLQHTAPFTPPLQVGTPSANLFGLWRFNEGAGTQTTSSAGSALGLGLWTWTTRTP